MTTQLTPAPAVPEKVSPDVIIVGGGHVGLSLALLLAKQGMSSTLLETNTYPTIEPNQDAKRDHYLDTRNTALSRRSVQIYQEIGLWESLADHACRIDAVHMSEQGSFGKARLLAHEENVESFGQVMENSWLGRKLLLACQHNPLISVIDGANVTTIEQTTSQVTVSYTKQQNIQNLTAKLLVAADGTHSSCRQLLGIEATHHDYQQTGIVAVVETDQPHNHVAIERFSKNGPVAVLPLPEPMMRSVVWVCKKGEEPRYLTDEAYFLATLQRAFGERAGRFLRAGKRGAYPLTKVLAERQVQGRCVILGNAAHTLHPVAGQGFNLCLRDAHVLTQLLSKQRQKKADIGDYQLLCHYAALRKKDQKRVELFCDTVVYSFGIQNPLFKVARNVGLIAFDTIPGVKQLIANYAMGLKA